MLLLAFLLPAWALNRLYVARRRRRRARDGHLLERQHRHSQRRDAHAPEHPRERRRDRPGLPAIADGRADGRAAVLPFVRIHRHASGCRRSSGFGVVYHPNPMDAKSDRRAGRPLPRDHHHQHAHVLLVVRPQVRAASSSSTCATRSSAPNGCANRSPPPSRRSSASICSKATAARRCRRSSRSTSRTSRTGASVSAARASARSDIRCRASPCKIVDPGDGRGSAVRSGRPAARQGPEPDARLSRRTEKTAEVIRDGWYVTGDIATIDEAGFVQHHRSAVALQQDRRRDGAAHARSRNRSRRSSATTTSCVVTSVPDDTRGERLVAFYTDPEVDAPDLWERLCQTELPRLWLPKARRSPFRRIDPDARHRKGRSARRAPTRVSSAPRQRPERARVCLHLSAVVVGQHVHGGRLVRTAAT